LSTATFIGLHNQSMIFRLSDADRTDFLKLDCASEFEPMQDRKMKGYVVLPEPAKQDGKELARWINRSLQFAAALPAKRKGGAAHRNDARAKPEAPLILRLPALSAFRPLASKASGNDVAFGGWHHMRLAGKPEI
jgi:hypothetical protein